MDKTETLARFLLSIPDLDLPGRVVERAKVHILDTLGVAVGGSRTAHARQSAALVEELGSTGRSTVIARTSRCNVADAAFLNGVSAHAIDFDDAHRFVHPGAAVVPTALAFAEHRGADGRRFVEAVVAGYEGSVRTSLAGGPAHRKRGFHPTGTCNVIGATASAALLLGLEPGEMVSAIGIACSQAGGLTQYRIDGAATKHLHAGFAARGGAVAVLLARQGLRGPAGAVDGELGFLNVLADGGEPERLVNGLGEAFAIATTDIKPFPSCRQTHAPVDLALTIFHDHGIRPDEIRSIELRTYDYCNKHWHVTSEPPPTSLEAMLNIPYCLATALTEGRLTLENFSDRELSRRDVHDMMTKITISFDPGLTAAWPAERGAVLTVRTARGDVTKRGTNPRGGEESPLEFAEVATKFAGLSEPVLGRKQTAALIEAVRTIDAAPGVDALCALLAGTDRPRLAATG